MQKYWDSQKGRDVQMYLDSYNGGNMQTYWNIQAQTRWIIQKSALIRVIKQANVKNWGGKTRKKKNSIVTSQTYRTERIPRNVVHGTEIIT